MKINENGITRDMTAAEVAAYESYLAAAPVETPPEDGSARLDEIEAALMELAAIVGGDGNG
mgnify:CR=1 FL=1